MTPEMLIYHEVKKEVENPFMDEWERCHASDPPSALFTASTIGNVAGQTIHQNSERGRQRSPTQDARERGPRSSIPYATPPNFPRSVATSPGLPPQSTWRRMKIVAHKWLEGTFTPPRHIVHRGLPFDCSAESNSWR